MKKALLAVLVLSMAFGVMTAAMTVAPTGLESEASWNTVSASTGAA